MSPIMYAPGDRIRVSTTYGEKFPRWTEYVGAEGTVTRVIDGTSWDGYIAVQLDCDVPHAISSGLYLPDEIEPCTP